MKKATSVNEIKIYMKEECKRAWRLLIEDTELLGKDSNVTMRSRTKWVTLNILYEDLFHETIMY
jgi:hypothetical protein